MSESTNKAADNAMRQIWAEWFTFYEKHFRVGCSISMADQMAFYEIAQPIMRELSSQNRAQPRSKS